MKINLDKTALSLRIMSIVAGAMIACMVAYAHIDDRMDKLEQEQATFKGVMDERTRNMQEKIKDIYDIVIEWGPVNATSQEKK